MGIGVSEGLVKTLISWPHPMVSDLVGLGWGPGPLALLPAGGGNRARGQSGEQGDQVLGQGPHGTASPGLHAGEKGARGRVGAETEPPGHRTSTGEHGKQEGLSPVGVSCAPGSWRGN